MKTLLNRTIFRFTIMRKTSTVLSLYCKVLLIISLKQVHINICLTIMLIGLRFYYIETVYASWFDETLFQVIDASKIDQAMGYNSDYVEYRETKPESSFNNNEDIEVPAEPISKPKLVEKPIVEYESHIPALLGDLKETDPKPLKSILTWYKESGFCLNNDINRCTNEYRQFISKLGQICYKEMIPINDPNTLGFLVLGTSHTGDTELYNITRAYIHLGLHTESVNANVQITKELIKEQFDRATNTLNQELAYYKNRGNEDAKESDSDTVSSKERETVPEEFQQIIDYYTTLNNRGLTIEELLVELPHYSHEVYELPTDLNYMTTFEFKFLESKVFENDNGFLNILSVISTNHQLHNTPPNLLQPQLQIDMIHLIIEHYSDLLKHGLI